MPTNNDDGITAVNDEERVSQSSSTRESNKILGVIYGIGMNVNTIIGSGIVVAPGIIWRLVNSPKIIIILWIIGGLVSLSGSLSYVELGVIHKTSGGETNYLKTAYPHPELMMSYLFSFMFIVVIRPGILCAVLHSAAQYFWFTIYGSRYNESIKENVDGWYLPFFPYWIIKIMAVIFLLIITLYHMLSNRWANYINQALAIIKLITYSIIAIIGIYRLFSDRDTRQKNWELGGSKQFEDYTASILLIMFSYNGWNNLNYSLDEFRKPERKLILSNSISVIIVILVYLLVNIAFFSVVLLEDVKGKDDETIAATFFHRLFGSNGAYIRIFTGLVVLSVIGTAGTNVWGGSRVIVAAAKSDFFLKYSRILGTRNERFNTPVNALIAQFIWCSLIIFFVGGSFTISSFSLFSTFAMYNHWIFYLATGVGLLLIRYMVPKILHKEIFNLRNSTDPRRELIEYKETELAKLQASGELYKVPLFVAGIFILGGLFIIIFSFVVKDIQNGLPIIISYGFLVVALISYRFWRRKVVG